MTESARLAWIEARIVALERQTPTILSFTFELGRSFRFVAGQHVDVRLTAEDGYRAQRSYSIASAPSSGSQIELAIERLPDGEVSSYFHEVAAPGDIIELRGPIGGHFVWSAGDGGPVLLLGAGSGVVPLLSMIRDRSAVRSGVPMMLLLSAASWQDVPYRDALIASAAERSGFDCALTLTREPSRRPEDFARRIDAEMLRAVLARMPGPPARVYVCGSNPFVETATRALEDNGVPPGRVRTERFGG